MSTDTVIIGCCGANLASLEFALARLGVHAAVTEDPERVRRATHVLLPGVGAAKDAMTRLERAGFAELVPSLTQPVLGICLGMQVLFEESAEERTKCLGVLSGRVERLPERSGLPIPQMGWNGIVPTAPTPLLEGIEIGAYAYFVHGYAAPVGAYTRATAEYGVPFSAVIEQGNFFGTQFHPERSSAVGARILANFVKL